MKPAYDQGFDQGYDRGYDRGYEAGYREGMAACGRLFPGTSIVIPTYNQADLLRQCLLSICEFTPEPHEVIVIDNASTDGTRDVVQRLARKVGTIRYRRLPENRGFAGGINQGLRMARGETVLLLNNDTVVTPRWLGQLLHVLRQKPEAGLVGPVTNYISGEQLVEVPYTTLSQMRPFADGFNRTDPSRWKATERLTGFCVLMSRETMLGTGYFDEGFEIGNCEDDDYGLRVRLLGKELVVAGDTFIHHVGSASMKSLGGRLDEVYGANQTYYRRKWEDPYLVFREVLAAANAGCKATSAVSFYPVQVAVTGCNGKVYWVEKGMKRPVVGDLPFPPVRLSRFELAQWPTGEAIGSRDVESSLEAAARPPSQSETWPGEGTLIGSRDGQVYQWADNRLRRFVGISREAWGLAGRVIHPVDDAWIRDQSQGLPILAPPVIRSTNL